MNHLQYNNGVADDFICISFYHKYWCLGLEKWSTYYKNSRKQNGTYSNMQNYTESTTYKNPLNSAIRYFIVTYGKVLSGLPTMKPTDGVNTKSGVSSDENEDTAPDSPAAAPIIEGAPIISAKKPDFSKVKIEPLFEDFVDFDNFSKSDFRAVKVLECEAVPKSKKLLKFTLDDGTGTNRTILSGIHAYYEPEQLIGKTCIAITTLPPRPMMGIESCGMLLSAIHEEEGEEKLTLLQVDPHIPAGAKLY